MLAGTADPKTALDPTGHPGKLKFQRKQERRWKERERKKDQDKRKRTSSDKQGVNPTGSFWKEQDYCLRATGALMGTGNGLRCQMGQEP